MQLNAHFRHCQQLVLVSQNFKPWAANLSVKANINLMLPTVLNGTGLKLNE